VIDVVKAIAAVAPHLPSYMMQREREKKRERWEEGKGKKGRGVGK
jgi:hypothetical protein